MYITRQTDRQTDRDVNTFFDQILVCQNLKYLKFDFKDILNKFGQYSLWTAKNLSNLFVHSLTKNGCIFKYIIPQESTLEIRKILQYNFSKSIVKCNSK